MFVYFIRESDSGLIKIGHSENPHKRLNGLQTGQAKVLEIVLCVKGGADLESRLHNVFNQHRVRGEWFLLKRSQLEYAATLAIRESIKESEKEYFYPDYEDVAIDADAEEKNDQRAATPEVAALVFRWIYNAMVSGEFSTSAIFASEEKKDNKRTLYLHTPSLEDAWSLCMPAKMKPTAQEIYENLKWIAPNRTKISGLTKGDRHNVRIVSREYFEAWLRNNRNSLNLDVALDHLAAARPAQIPA